VDRAFEAVEDIGLARDPNLEGFVVIVAALVSSGHGKSPLPFMQPNPRAGREVPSGNGTAKEKGRVL
jgi:hypothetical protein